MHNCVKCGKQEDGHWAPDVAAQVVERQMCFSCNYWWKYLNSPVKEEYNHHHSTAVVIDGKVFTDGGYIDKPHASGFGIGHAGRKFRIRMLDGSKEFVTNNLWAGGEVPALWRDMIPDTAEFLPVETAQNATARIEGGLVDKQEGV